jgi:hypothetical protein
LLKNIILTIIEAVFEKFLRVSHAKRAYPQTSSWSKSQIFTYWVNPALQ